MRKWIATILIILAALLACLPYLAAFPPLKQYVLRFIGKSIDADVEVEHLRLSWLGPQKLMGVRFQTHELSATFEEVETNSPLWSITKTRNFTLSGGRVHAPETSGSIENIQVRIVASDINITGITRENHKSGTVSIQGTYVNPNHFDLLIDLQTMPTPIVDWVLKTKGKLQFILGPTFDLEGHVATNEPMGSFDLALTSPTVHTSVTGSITERAITLSRDLVFTLYLTPSMSLSLFGFKASVTGQDPIVLSVRSHGFEFPRPFSVQNLKIGLASLSLGRLWLQNASYLSGLSIFLKTNKANTKQVNAWFNRSDFSVEDGVLDLKRTDALLANSIHLCTWGKANLVDQTLDMILGIPEELLRQTFGIKTLSSKYVLQIPLKGTFQEPYLDTDAARKKIAMIVAASKLQEKGGILGEAVGVFNQAALEKSPPPNAPFPWEK